MKRLAFSYIVFHLLAFACAGPHPPTGGPRIEHPPMLVATEPEALQIVDGWKRPVVFRFSERISQQGLEQVALVSPETGKPRVRRRGTEIHVTIDGGWKADMVYRVVLLPGIRDLFGNTRRQSVELVFSTGPPLPETALAGIVTDRITGRAVDQARVEAVPGDLPAEEDEKLVYVASSDTAGFFALHYLPPGEYFVRSYVDMNRNREPDDNEPQDSAVTRVQPGDTVFLSMDLLVPDTVPANLLRAEARDSMQIRLFFDDHLDPDEDQEDLAVSLVALPDSAQVAVKAILFPHQFEEMRRLEAPPDTLVADTLVADTAVAAQAEPPRQQERQDAPILPTRELVVVPEEPLEGEALYLVEVRHLVNIAGLPGGGGVVEFETPAWQPARQDTSFHVRR